MKALPFVFLSFLIVHYSFGQISQQDKETIIYEYKEGLSFLITTKVISGQKDSAQITITRLISSSGGTIIQQLLLPTSYPVEIESISVYDKPGFTFKYDPAARNGNPFLYLFNEYQGKFEEVKGYWNLGGIETIAVNGKNYKYSYKSCGCADACWKSEWFEINEYRVVSKASIGCDCKSFVKNGTKRKEDCSKFSNNNKFELIKEYWINLIKSQL